MKPSSSNQNFQVSQTTEINNRFNFTHTSNKKKQNETQRKGVGRKMRRKKMRRKKKTGFCREKSRVLKKYNSKVHRRKNVDFVEESRKCVDLLVCLPILPHPQVVVGKEDQSDLNVEEEGEMFGGVEEEMDGLSMTLVVKISKKTMEPRSFQVEKSEGVREKDAKSLIDELVKYYLTPSKDKEKGKNNQWAMDEIIDYVNNWLFEYFSRGDVGPIGGEGEGEFLNPEEKGNEFDLLEYEKKKKTKKKKKSVVEVKSLEDGKQGRKKNIVVEKDEKEIQKFLVMRGQTDVLEWGKESDEVLEDVNFKIQAKQCSKMLVHKFGPDDFDLRIFEPNIHKFAVHLVEMAKIKNWKKKLGSTQLQQVQKARKIIWAKIGKFASTKGSFSSVFRRKEYALCSRDNTLFIYGGENEKSLLSDLIRIDTKKNDIAIFRNLQFYGEDDLDYSYTKSANQYLQIPAMSGHKMVWMNNGLLILSSAKSRSQYYSKFNRAMRRGYTAPFSTELLFYFISHPFSNKKIHLGIEFEGTADTNRDTNTYLRRRHPVRCTNHSFIPGVENFSVNLLNVKGKTETIFLFGGRSIWGNKGKGSNSLFSIKFDDAVNPWGKEIKVYKIHRKSKELFYPRERFGHSSATIYSNIYIFGGKTYSSNEERVLNDLLMYDTNRNEWTEIEVDLLKPKPSSFCCFGSLSTTEFFLFGGQQHKGYINSNMYHFSYKENSYKVAKVLDIEANNHVRRNLALERKEAKFEINEEITKYGMGFAVTGSHKNKSLYFFGGKKKAQISGDFYKMEYYNDVGEEFLLFKYLNEKRKLKFLTDMKFIVKQKKEDVNDSDKIEEFFVHLCILNARCPKLVDELMKDKDVKKDKDGCYIVELFKKSEKHNILNSTVFECFLNFVYTGNIILEGEKNITELLRFVEYYYAGTKFKLSIFNKICRKRRRFLEDCDSLLRDISEDFKGMFDPLSHGNKDNYSDVDIIFADSSKLKLHKLFLCRSNYFRAMLFSNFKESIDNEINFNQFNKTAIIDIISYLYSDRLDAINPENCIEILIYSLQFEIKNVCNYCRRIVEEYITVGNILDLIGVAELYQDQVLKRICVSFIVCHYEDVSLLKDYSKLENSTRDAVSKGYDRKKRRDDKKRKKMLRNRKYD